MSRATGPRRKLNEQDLLASFKAKSAAQAQTIRQVETAAQIGKKQGQWRYHEQIWTQASLRLETQIDALDAALAPYRVRYPPLATFDLSTLKREMAEVAPTLTKEDTLCLDEDGVPVDFLLIKASTRDTALWARWRDHFLHLLSAKRDMESTLMPNTAEKSIEKDRLYVAKLREEYKAEPIHLRWTRIMERIALEGTHVHLTLAKAKALADLEDKAASTEMMRDIQRMHYERQCAQLLQAALTSVQDSNAAFAQREATLAKSIERECADRERHALLDADRSDFDRMRKALEMEILALDKQRRLEEEALMRQMEKAREADRLALQQWRQAQKARKEASEEERARVQALFEKEQAILQAYNEERVAYREAMLEEKANEQKRKAAEKEAEEAALQERLAQLAESVAPHVEKDADRAMASTIASQQVRDLQLPRRLFPVNGYHDDTITSDIRFKINAALCQQQLQGSTYARELLSQLPEPRHFRADLASQIKFSSAQ